MDAVGLFLKSDISETSPENDDVYFPDTISTSVPISHPQTLADSAEEKRLKSWVNILLKKKKKAIQTVAFFSGHFSVFSFSFKRRNERLHHLAARLIHRSRRDFTPVDQRRLYRKAPCCITAECNTIRHYKLLFTPQTQERETRVNLMTPSSDYQRTTWTAPLTFHEHVQLWCRWHVFQA